MEHNENNNLKTSASDNKTSDFLLFHGIVDNSTQLNGRLEMLEERLSKLHNVMICSRKPQPEEVLKTEKDVERSFIEEMTFNLKKSENITIKIDRILSEIEHVVYN